MTSNEDIKLFSKELIKRLRSRVSTNKINKDEVCSPNSGYICALCKGELEERFYTMVKTELEPPKLLCQTCGKTFHVSFKQSTQCFDFKVNCNCQQELASYILDAIRNYKKETSLLICKECAEKIGLEEVFGIEKL